jgi:hypothetical protein
MDTEIKKEGRQRESLRERERAEILKKQREEDRERERGR